MILFKSYRPDESRVLEDKKNRDIQDRIQNESDRYMFDKKGEPLTIDFSYWYRLKFGKPEFTHSVTIFLNRNVSVKWLERRIKNAIIPKKEER